MELLFILIGALVGAGVLYVIIKPKLKATQELDEATKLQNEELHTELVALEKQHATLTARRQEIFELSGHVESLDDMTVIDELVQEILSQKS